MIKIICTVIFVAVGLLNLYPLIGAISVEKLTGLSGVPFDSPDLVILMRHRAILFGLLGGYLLYAAFRPSLQITAALVGLTSMASFTALAYLSNGIGPEIQKVALADTIGSIAILIALIIALWQQQRRRNTF